MALVYVSEVLTFYVTILTVIQMCTILVFF